MKIDIGKVLKRAWHVLWNFKVLWIFGILLAADRRVGSHERGNKSGYRFDANDRLNRKRGSQSLLPARRMR